MIIFLYGPDGYRLNKEADSVIQKYRQKHASGVNFFNFDLSSSSIRDIENTIKTVSFFDEIKLVVIRSVFFVKDSVDLIELIKNYDVISDKGAVLLIKESLAEKDLIAKNKKLFGLLSGEKSLVRKFESLVGKKLEDWVRKEFYDRNCSISPVVIRRLIDMVGKDNIRLIYEIDKISNYKLKGEIRSEDIDKLVNPNIELNIFHLLDAIAARNKSKSLELLYSELKTGRDLYYILTMVAYQLRNMLIIKDLADRGLSAQEISKKSGIHQFVVGKSMGLLSKISKDDLSSKFSSLAKMDIMFKNGQADLEDYFYNFVLMGLSSH